MHQLETTSERKGIKHRSNIRDSFWLQLEQLDRERGALKVPGESWVRIGELKSDKDLKLILRTSYELVVRETYAGKC